jgi:hypothetical protein
VLHQILLRHLQTFLARVDERAGPGLPHKGRGFCPSCCGRRMAESGMHLVDDVLPPVPIRQ